MSEAFLTEMTSEAIRVRIKDCEQWLIDPPHEAAETTAYWREQLKKAIAELARLSKPQKWKTT